MSFLIDTDVCSAYLKQVGTVTNRFMQHAGQLHISTITAAELYTWALRAKAPPLRLQGLLDLLGEVTVHDLNHDVAREFGRLRSGFLDAGQAKPVLDLLIAATALVHNLTVVTHNSQDFSGIPGLSQADWLSP